jgi:hypothetical protein
VLLGTPAVDPTAHIEVPASKGYVDGPIGDGVSRGFITDSVWWRAQRRNLIDTHGVTPNELVIMLTKDTAVGLALGVHGARVTGDQIQTSVWASWLSPRWAVPFGFQPGFDKTPESSATRSPSGSTTPLTTTRRTVVIHASAAHRSRVQ